MVFKQVSEQQRETKHFCNVLFQFWGCYTNEKIIFTALQVCC